MQHSFLSPLVQASVIGLSLLLSACGSNSKTSEQFAKESLSLDQTQSTIVDSYRALATDTSAYVTLQNEEFQSPRRIERSVFGRVSPSPLPAASVEEIALNAANKLFPQYEVKFLKAERGSVFTYVTLEQFHQGVPVYNARLVLRLNGNGDWETASSTMIEPALLPTGLIRGSLDAQIQTLLPEATMILDAKDVIMPKRASEGMQFHFAKQVSAMIQVTNAENESLPPFEVVLWIDHATGRALAAWNPSEALMDESMRGLKIVGRVVPDRPEDKPAPLTFSSLTAILEDGSKLLSDTQGAFDRALLEGSKSFTLSLEHPTLVVKDAKRSTGSWSVDHEQFSQADSLNMDLGPTSLEERNIFYWLVEARRYLREQLKYDGMQTRILAIANYGENFDNAFFMPLTKSLAFGQGSRVLKNTSLSRDIVMHEYGHAVTYQIYGAVGGYEFSAMNEAFSDYLAASITNEPLIADGAMMPSFGRDYLRTVENTMVYPADFKGTRFHEDGQMFSGALWDLRKKIGAQLADEMVHEARLAQAKSIKEFLLELLKIDEAKRDDGDPFTPSPNSRAIWNSFRAHGLDKVTSWKEAKEDLTIPWKRPKPNTLGCF